jgi:hypothetical protein
MAVWRHKEISMASMKTVLATTSGLLLLCMVVTASAADNIDEQWKAEQIADALKAAPASVTENAKIYAWTDQGEMVMVRDGTGPYTCVASGFASLRLGKPALPYPDPWCLDQNAWAFMTAVWSEKDPLHPQKPYPTAPGLAWMLAGMNIKQGAMAVGKDEKSVVKTMATDKAGKEIIQMTPHVMIMPVPFNKKSANLPTSYTQDNPLNSWVMAAGTPIEHLMVHFSDAAVAGMMGSGE